MSSDLEMRARELLATEHETQGAGVDEVIERLRGNRKLWMADLVGGQISLERMTAIVTAALAGQPKEDES